MTRRQLGVRAGSAKDELLVELLTALARETADGYDRPAPRQHRDRRARDQRRLGYRQGPAGGGQSYDGLRQ